MLPPATLTHFQIARDLLVLGAGLVLDRLLDAATLDVIRTHYTSTQPQQQLKKLGLKAFLIYQKARRHLQRLTSRAKKGKLIIAEVSTPLFRTISELSNSTVYEKSKTIINLTFVNISGLSQTTLQKVKNIYSDIRYSKTTNTLVLLGQDAFQTALKIVQFLLQAMLDTLELKRSRKLYNNISKNYQSLKVNYKQIKEQSQILSQMFSDEEIKERGAEFDDRASATKVGKLMVRSIKSEDNLYNLRKISFGGNKEILEEDQLGNEDSEGRSVVDGSKTIPDRTVMSDQEQPEQVGKAPQEQEQKQDLEPICEAKIEESPTQISDVRRQDEFQAEMDAKEQAATQRTSNYQATDSQVGVQDENVLNIPQSVSTVPTETVQMQVTENIKIGETADFCQTPIIAEEPKHENTVQQLNQEEDSSKPKKSKKNKKKR